MSKEQKREPCYLIEINSQQDLKGVKISPTGNITGIDGRTYVIDGNAVVEKTKGRNLDIVLNVNHGYDQHQEKAAGWFPINSLELKNDGIYADLEPTNIGQELIDEKHFRYLSPEYRVAYDQNNRIVMELVGVGLVNRPNVLDEALNNEEPIQNQTEEETVEKPTETQTEENTRIKQLEEENAQLKLKEKKSKIDMAIAKGELMPNKQEFAMGLDGKMLDGFLALNREDSKHLSTQTTPDKPEESKELSDAQKEVNAQLGLTEEEK